jgi:hypothetical protein
MDVQCYPERAPYFTKERDDPIPVSEPE